MIHHALTAGASGFIEQTLHVASTYFGDELPAQCSIEMEARLLGFGISSGELPLLLKNGKYSSATNCSNVTPPFFTC